MVVLLLVTALFSPGFLSASNLRSVLVLAAFVGIVALGQTFVIIGGGIDLSVPWVLNSAAILMALLCGGQSLPLLWVAPLLLAGGAGDRARQRHRRRALRRAADHHDARRQRHPAGPDPGPDRRLADPGGARRDPLPLGRPPRPGAGDRADLGCAAPSPRACCSRKRRLRPPPLRPRHQRDRRRLLRRADRAHHDPDLHALRRHGRPRRDAADRLLRPGLSRHGRQLPLHLDRRGRDRRRLDPRRQRPLHRHRRRRAGADHPLGAAARAQPLERRAPRRLRRRHPRHRLDRQRAARRPRRGWPSARKE